MTNISITVSHDTDLSRHEFSERVDLHIENEISFLVPVTVINQVERRPDLYPLEKSIIEQRYFSKSFIPAALEYLQSTDSAEFDIYEAAQFSQARVRRNLPLKTGFPVPEAEYDLTLKSPKFGDGERLEISRKLNITEYLNILALVDESNNYSQDGYLLKERSKMTGITNSGFPVELEIDSVIAAGNKKRFRHYQRESLPYLKVGCESDSLEGIGELLDMKHNINFLKHESVILLNKSHPLSAYMSMSYIASKGIKESKIRSLLAEAA